MKLYGIVGLGGFGREVMSLAEPMLQKEQEDVNYQVVFVVEDKNQQDMINNQPVFNLEEFLDHPATEKYFNVAITNPEDRRRIVEMMLSKKILPFSIRAENRVELDCNTINEGAIFCSYTVVGTNTIIGKYFQANTLSYIAHDCSIGDYVTFAANVICNGNVIIEDNVYVGPGVVINEGAVLSKGAVVTKNVAANETVAATKSSKQKEV